MAGGDESPAHPPGSSFTSARDWRATRLCAACGNPGGQYGGAYTGNGGNPFAIDLNRDKNPSYQVDSISNQIYYRVSPTEVVGYRF